MSTHINQSINAYPSCGTKTETHGNFIYSFELFKGNGFRLRTMPCCPWIRIFKPNKHRRWRKFRLYFPPSHAFRENWCWAG